jgi:hypothetical protein
MKRVFANRRDWRSYLSRIECGCTLHHAYTLAATRSRQGDFCRKPTAVIPFPPMDAPSEGTTCRSPAN